MLSSVFEIREVRCTPMKSQVTVDMVSSGILLGCVIWANHRYKVYYGLSQRQHVPLTSQCIGYQYIMHYVHDAVLEAKPILYHPCKMYKAPKLHNFTNYLLCCMKTASYQQKSILHKISHIDYVTFIFDTGVWSEI